MEEKRSPKKALKKKRPKNISTAVVSDSDDSDNETPDLNGIDMVSNANDDSSLSDGGWSSDDDRELVQKVKSTSKQSDKVSYKTRLKQLNWNDIAFKSYTAKDCEKRFQTYLKHVRRHRNLNEIATDIEANIKKCPLKKPLNSYQLFIQDQLTNVKSSGDFSERMKNLGTLYKELPSEEKAIYDRKAEQLRMEYKQKKSEFESGNISMKGKIASDKPVNDKAKTPFMLYAESKKLEESDHGKLRQEYSNLSLDEKYKWVIKAVSEAQDRSHENVTKILNKEEQRIYKGQVKTTPTAYSLYVKEVYSKIKDEHNDSKNVFTEIATRWKSLDPKKKKRFLDAAAILKEKALQEQDAFNERHGMTPQKSKRRKSTYVERPPEIKSEDEELETVPKKRKISASIESSSDETNTKQIQIKLPIKKKSAVKQKPEVTQQSPTKLSSPTKFNSPAKLSSPKQEIKSPETRTVAQSPAKFDHENEPVKEKKKKKKLNSESSEFNESDAVHSSSSSGSKKKSKKEKKEVIEPPTEKPPSDVFAYFAKYIHTGKPKKAQKAFEKLPKDERKRLKAEYNEKVEVYVDRLKRYLGTLSREEASAYVQRVKAQDAENEAEQDVGGSSQEY